MVGEPKPAVIHSNGDAAHAVAPSVISPVSNPEMHDALHGAFLLGWLIMELRSRIKVAYAQCAAPNPRKGFGIQLASQWRALFSRIADEQHQTFPNGVTAKTLYAPPSVPYLHPEEMPDYADIGLQVKSENS